MLQVLITQTAESLLNLMLQNNSYHLLNTYSIKYFTRVSLFSPQDHYFLNDKSDPQRDWITSWDHSGCKCQTWVLNSACVTTKFVHSMLHCPAASPSSWHHSYLPTIPNIIVFLGHSFRSESLSFFPSILILPQLLKTPHLPTGL